MSDGTEKVIRKLTGTLTSTRRNKEVADALLLLDKELSKRNFVAITSHLQSPTCSVCRWAIAITQRYRKPRFHPLSATHTAF